MRRHVPITADAAERLLAPTDPWLSCNDCFDRVDLELEAMLGRDEAPAEDFRTHLVSCAACRDETASLAALIAPDFGLDSQAAVEVLDRHLAVPGRRGR
ncbi:hypothetical protein [Nocardioides terrisoli]|uniref:hypothetical protein n=1 Tax=Nocardioides terrisoli TaxID=3388267 RepID=UPI00287B73C1|nr:hypothetical protein [Nocardioides marmorisolisilvae]